MGVVAIDIVGLTPRLLEHMPGVRKVGEDGWSANLQTILPAVTCSVQSTLLTGELPSKHGIVGNGWYFRDLGEVLLWRQHNRLVQAEPVWEAARRKRPGFSAANICWWYAMGMTTNMTVTPRPIYYSDGAKEPDCYTDPPELHDRLIERVRDVPAVQLLGPDREHPAHRSGSRRRRGRWSPVTAPTCCSSTSPISTTTCRSSARTGPRRSTRRRRSTRSRRR